MHSNAIVLLHVLNLALVGDRDLSSVGFQLSLTRVSKSILINAECEVELCGIIFSDPKEGLVILRVHALHVFQLNGFPQHHFVEWTDEERCGGERDLGQILKL